MFFLDSKNHVTFGSKAKLPATEPDILELAIEDSDYYLSEIDEPPKRLSSAIVRAENISKINPVHVKEFSHQQQQNRASVSQSTRGLSNSKKRTNKYRLDRHRAAAHNLKPRGTQAKPNIVRPNSVTTQTTTNQKTFETRGTQTERIGPCKCARAVQAKNHRRRLDSKKNKQLVEALVNHHTQRA